MSLINELIQSSSLSIGAGVDCPVWAAAVEGTAGVPVVEVLETDMTSVAAGTEPDGGVAADGVLAEPR